MISKSTDPEAVSLRVMALTLFAVMVWMLVSPATFHAGVAGFGDLNTHFIRDTATFILPLAAALWMAATRPAWRVPVLGLALAQNGLHVLNHLADVNRSDPGWHGPVNLLALVVLELALWQTLRYHRRRSSTPPASA